MLEWNSSAICMLPLFVITKIQLKAERSIEKIRDILILAVIGKKDGVRSRLFSEEGLMPLIQIAIKVLFNSTFQLFYQFILVQLLN